MAFLGIIPARYASTRLEGKPLADICGKPMIQHVYERVNKALQNVYVATDDNRIVDAVKSFGGNVVLTSAQHNSGTNRCLEAYEIIEKLTGESYDVIINIQGDEPMIEPAQLNELTACFDNPTTELATLVAKVTNNEDLLNKSEVFVTFDKNMKALYFSRAVIPEIKDVEKSEWLNMNTYYKHIGLYAYTPSALQRFAGLPQSNLELTEGLEQNRWLENGYSIYLAVTKYESAPVDTKEDLEKIRKIMCK
jgi:3-deoxy-manno-octulosonate cytidylyltransferase (CMP-KDO synthetase)